MKIATLLAVGLASLFFSSQSASGQTNFVSYANKSETNFVLCLSGVNWTEAVAAPGSPPIISDVVGKAGVGATAEEAKEKLAPLKTKKDKSGTTLVYFEQEKPFKGVGVFYLDLQSGSAQLAHNTLVELKFAEKK
jgi:hypothetical protein